MRRQDPFTGRDSCPSSRRCHFTPSSLCLGLRIKPRPVRKTLLARLLCFCIMAKPKHGRWNNHDRQPPSLCARALSRPLPRFPSPAVLSALAVIATTPPVVAGSPLPFPTPPPTFLCPFIERDSINPSSDILDSPPLPTIPSSSTPSPTPAPRAHHNNHQLIADRYVEGSDSLWRKTNQWTLYGSTVSVVLPW